MSSSRLLRVSGSFALVLVAYGLYAFLVLPWIEPPADLRRSEEINAVDEQSSRQAQLAKIEELTPLFPPGSPLLTGSTKMLEGPQIRVLYNEMHESDQATRHILTPCTVVYTPEEPIDDRAEQIRRSVVLEAPEGAELQFSEAFDLLHTKVGLPISGCLRGRVTIRCAGNDPGPDDDLLVVTQRINLNKDRIWTIDPVEFAWGRSHGRGSNLTVGLQHAEGPADSAKIVGIEWLELLHLDRLHLEPASHPAAPAATAGPLELGRSNEPLVLDVAFRGPLRFDLVKREARLRDQVDIVQRHANGGSDRLTCEEMLIDFAHRRKTAAPEADKEATETASLSDLEPWQIRAMGNPIDIRAPSREFQGRCSQLTYNLRNRRIYLAGTPEAFLQQGTRELYAPTLEYQPADDPRLSLIQAKGPGVVRAIDRREGQPERVFVARWTNLLKLEPDPQQQPCLTLQGDAQVESPGLGALQAGEINLWLLVAPAVAGQPPQMRPDRMLATPAVRLKSPQLSGQLERLEIWFREVDAQQEALKRQKLAEVGLYSQVQSRLEQAQLATQLARTVAVPPAAAASSGDPLAANNHFDVLAQRLQAEVLMRGQKPEPSKLTITGNVEVTQTATERPDQIPVRIKGDQIVVSDAMQPYATINILGQPGHFEGQGFGLTGGNIDVKRGQNQLSIAGPGEMIVPLPRDLAGRPTAKPGSLSVQWQHDMNFNGQTCVFTGSVVGRTQDQQVQTEQLDVSFQQPINFSQIRARSQPDWARIVAHGEVRLLDRTVDPKGKPTRTEMMIRELVLDNQSGEISGVGPGWMTSVRHTSGDMLTPEVPGSPQAAPRVDENQLNYLQVRFQQGLGGNLHERRVTFQQAIRAIFGPVPSYEATLDPDDPNEPKAGNARLDADELSIVQMPLPNDPRQSSVELGTRGNTIVRMLTTENASITARADRLTYVQTKNLVTLVGDGLMSYAQLYYQSTPGAVPSHSEAQRITLRLRPWDVQLDGARNTTLQLPSAAPRGR